MLLRFAPIRAAYQGVLRRLPRTLGARLEYIRAHHRLPNFARPRRFNEHLYAQKLWGDHEAFVDLTDKIRVKEVVARRLGAAFVVPTLWHGPALPPRAARDWPLPFVLKANHGSRMNALLRGPAELDWDALERQAALWLRTDWPPWLQEDWYNRIERQLLVEPLLDDGTGALPDYKVFVFGGRAHFVQVDANRFGQHTQAFHGRDWKRLPFRRGLPAPPEPAPRPRHLREILDAAETMGEGFEFVRVDFYDLPNGPKFGEMTFAPGAGLVPFEPEEYDLVLGRIWAEARAALRRDAGAPAA